MIKNKTGSGSVLKYRTLNGTLWRYRFEGEPVDGKRRIISAQGFETKKDAKAALQKAVAAFQVVGPAPAPPEQTLADWVRVWLRDYGPNSCSPLTLQRYGALAGYILDATAGEPAQLASTALNKVDHRLLESALYFLLRAPAKRREHLSSKTVREVAGVLSVSLNKAFKLGLIAVNPFARVELPKIGPKKEARSLVPEEIQRLRDVCRNDWTFAFIELSLATGAITWPDVDYINSMLTISRSIEETKFGLRVKLPKNGKTRKFRIGATPITALRFLQEEQKQQRVLCGQRTTRIFLSSSFASQTDRTFRPPWSHKWW
jgi:Arm DNA-binding domain